MQQVNLGIIGGGTVGGGVFNALQTNGALMASRLGIKIHVVKVAAKALEEPQRKVKIPHSQITLDWKSLVHDPQVQVVAELAGGTTVARSRNPRSILTATMHCTRLASLPHWRTVSGWSPPKFMWKGSGRLRRWIFNLPGSLVTPSNCWG